MLGGMLAAGKQASAISLVPQRLQALLACPIHDDGGPIMCLSLTPTGMLDDANALYLAVASQLVYGDDARPWQEHLGLLGTPVTVDHLQAFVGSSDSDVVVAFRGSQSPLTAAGRQDWLLTDARQLLVRPPEGEAGADFAGIGPMGLFHQGFMAALAVLWDRLLLKVQAALQSRGRRLWLTGHSLGGALAALAAWRLQVRGILVHRVYSFGAPMFCDAAAAEAYNLRLGSTVFRFVNEADLVSALPLSRLLHNEYRHIGQAEILGADEATALPPARNLLARLRAAAELFTVPFTAAKLLGRELARRAAAHGISKGYISRLRDRLGSASKETNQPARQAANLRAAS
jgi:hypothetical protein